MNNRAKFALVVACGLCLLGTAPARAQVTVNINPPSWGPPAPAGTQYYYVPEIGGYYYLPGHYYVVERKGKWQHLKTIDGYSPRSFHPVVIDYRGFEPWVLITRHRQLYPGHLPPGQVKRLESGKGLPPGQAKKLYGGHGKGHGHGKH